jgi:hypothetical protein
VFVSLEDRHLQRSAAAALPVFATYLFIILSKAWFLFGGVVAFFLIVLSIPQRRVVIYPHSVAHAPLLSPINLL